MNNTTTLYFRTHTNTKTGQIFPVDQVEAENKRLNKSKETLSERGVPDHGAKVYPVSFFTKAIVYYHQRCYSTLTDTAERGNTWNFC